MAAWSETFAEHPEIEVERRDYFEARADAIVSPANSFGIMDGGIDAAIARELPGIERVVQRMIRERHHGELHVGTAEVVATDDARWPFLVCAPTMRIPEDVSRSTSAYLAFRATLLAVRAHNATSSAPIRTLLCCGLATGVGAMPPRRCAVQMRLAYKQVEGDGSLPTFREIHEHNRVMRTVT